MYLRPTTLSEAVHSLAASGGNILSGGTDFFPALGERAITGTVVDISGVGELRGIALEQGYVRIGGLTTWTQLIAAPLPRCFDALKAAAREIGSVQIQNRGTVAGNLCNASPAADSVPPLLALDAEVELVSSAGTRRVPLADFITGNRKTARQPDEILSNVLVPRAVDNAASVFLKLGARRYLVISIAMVAVVLEKDMPCGTRMWNLGGEAVGHEAGGGEPARGVKQVGDGLLNRGELEAFDGAVLGAGDDAFVVEGPVHGLVGDGRGCGRDADGAVGGALAGEDLAACRR